MATNMNLELIYTKERRIACDGGGGTLGHPKIYLEMGDSTQVICPYCSRHFVLEED